MRPPAPARPLPSLPAALALAIAAAVLLAPALPASARPAIGSAPARPTDAGGVPTVASTTFGLATLGAAATTASATPEVRHLDVADGTQSVGLSWAGDAHGEVAVRGRTATGWTDWQDLHGDAAEGPDRTRRTGTQLAWLATEGVNEVEVRVEEGPLPDLELQAIRAEAPATTSSASATTAAAADGRPAIEPRSSWTTKGWIPTNPDCTPAPELAVQGVEYAVVHHTDTPNGYAAADVPAMIASIYAFHTGTNRWCDIAYNVIVDRFGRAWEGRSGGVASPVVGGHAKGFNRGSVGVSVLGSLSSAAPSSATLRTVGQVIGWKLALHRHDPTARTTVVSGGGPRYPEGQVVTIDRVVGHRDVGRTDCPGSLLHAELDAIAATAKAFQATLPAPSAPTAPFRISHDLVVQQYRDVLRRDPTAERVAWWSARIDAGTSTPGDLVSFLVTSQEADDLLHATTRLYRAYFGRNPDHAGFTYWAGRRAGGTTLARISNTFAASSEFARTYGSLTNAQFVDLVYANVLGRAPDAAGRAYWERKIAAGTSRGVVMLQFSQSSEFVRATRAGTWVVATYEALLGRAVTDTAYATLVAAFGAGTTTASTMATNLLVSDSYRRRIAALT